MILVYGNMQRPNGEVGVSITRKALKDSAQRYWAHEETWVIDGMITTHVSPESSAISYIRQQCAMVESMFAVEERDLGLRLASGGWSHHRIQNATTVGGVRIVDPVSYPESNGTEGVTHRKYRVTLMAIRPTVTTQLMQDMVLSFEETCQYEGGGARDIYVETLTGRPQRQRARQNTVYRVTQKGSAVGLHSRPPVPPPIWPSSRIAERPVVTMGHPRRVGSSLIEWPITWQYVFESSSPLIGYPNEWGQTYGT
jgi:hypothetical protein